MCIRDSLELALPSEPGAASLSDPMQHDLLALQRNMTALATALSAQPQPRKV